MSKTTKPNKQRVRHTSNFTWNQFAKDCLLNIYTLVVGSEAILNRNVYPETDGNSMKMLLNKTLYYKASETILEEFPNDDISIHNDDIYDEYQRLKKRNSSFSQFDRKEKNIKELVWKATNQMINDGIDIGAINPALLELLKTRCFRIVITTDVSPFLELAMDSVWGENGYDIIKLENAQESFKQVFDEFDVVKPTLCYAFGKVDSDVSKFVLTENDAIEKISRLFESKKNNSFLSYLRNYSILSVGPKFDDWLFRFFWFLLRGKIHSKLNETEQTEDGLQIAVEINKEIYDAQTNGDDSLTEYLKQEKVKVFTRTDAKEFLNNAVIHIKEASHAFRSLCPIKDDGVFISYSHKDKYIAFPLYKKLQSEGIPVWIDDEELDDGDEFKPRIADAINSCRFFLPILSTTTIGHISSGILKEQWYYQNEWCLIDKRYRNEERQNAEIKKLDETSQPKHKFKTIPFIVGDYKFSENYHQSTPDCFREASISNTFELAKDKVEHLIEIIKQQ